MGLEIKDVAFSYGKKKVLNGVDIDVEEGEIYALLGGSGSGKTTLLGVVAGFLEPYRGSIILDGRNMTGVSMESRGVGVVFQDYALFPHMTVGSNIRYPMEIRRFSKKERGERTEELLTLVGLTGYDNRYPSELSGGEKQRVALARTLASEPSLILLDEPLSALDASLRDGLRRELRRILKASSVPSIYVTHDQMEAVSISDRMGLLHGGRILEEGDPARLFRAPKKLDTARFMGFRNIFRVHERTREGLRTSLGTFSWKGKAPTHIAFRADSIVPSGEGDGLRGKVRSRELKGSRISLVIEVKGEVVEMDLSPEDAPPVGESISFFIPSARMVPLVK